VWLVLKGNTCSCKFVKHPSIYFLEEISFVRCSSQPKSFQINPDAKWKNWLITKKVSQDGKPIFHKSLVAKSSQCSRTLLLMLLDRYQFDNGSLALKSIATKSKTITGILINTFTLYYGVGGVWNYSPGVYHHWERWLILLPVESNR